MTQLCLFDLAQVAPTRGEQRAARAEARRKERQETKRRNALKWARRQAEREDRARAYPETRCCGYWYGPGHGWSRCHKCGKALR